jgi:hypothetical protein
VDEAAEVPGVDVLIRRLACGVVAAGEDAGDVVDFVLFKVLQDVQRELFQERQIVFGVDDENALWVGG